MEMNNRKRAQAALEFLTTYGWAFLVILIMIGALAYFGVLNPSNLVPDSCTAGNGFTCREFKATSTVTSDSIQLVVVNSLESIKIAAITDINLTQTGTSTCVVAPTTVDDFVVAGATFSANQVVQAGQIMTIGLDCSTGLVAGERFQGDLAITYTPSGKTLPKTAIMEVSVKATE